MYVKADKDDYNCQVMKDKWGDVKAEEVVYNGSKFLANELEYAISLKSSKGHYHLMMVNDTSPLKFISYKKDGSDWTLVLGSKYTDAEGLTNS